MQMHTLCTQFAQTFCTLNSQSCQWKSVHWVCRCTLDAHMILQTSCILYAYPGVYINLILGRLCFGAIEMSYKSISTRFLDKIPRQKLWLRAHSHYLHTFIWCMHTLFGRMHTLFRHWKRHLFVRVLQTPSELLLVSMVLFHSPLSGSKL